MRAAVWVLALLALGGEAWAERVTLEYERTRDAAACPPAAALRDKVHDRLGYDPFRAGEARIVRVHMDATTARVDVLEDGALIGRRDLAAPSGCVELTEAVALAVSIAIDPRAAMAPRPRPVAAFDVRPLVDDVPAVRPGFRDPVPRGSSPPAVAATATVPVSPADSDGATYYVSAGVVAAIGTEPDASTGATAGVGMGRGAWRLHLEGRYDQTRSAAFGPGQVRAGLRFGAVIPCLQRGSLSACGVVAAGSLIGGSAGLDNPREATSAFVAVGARGAAELWRLGPVSVRVHVDGLGALSRGRLLVSGMDAWTMPPWSAAVGVGAVGRFR